MRFAADEISFCDKNSQQQKGVPSLDSVEPFQGRFSPGGWSPQWHRLICAGGEWTGRQRMGSPMTGPWSVWAGLGCHTANRGRMTARLSICFNVPETADVGSAVSLGSYWVSGLSGIVFASGDARIVSRCGTIVAEDVFFRVGLSLEN